ncbi:hypothetical protein Lnau_1039 [Legionella nautarum]|uniref:Uncharacterized protein n=1 Tax=Legionella nautarum TaxID=45070 RepID=A0A0W0WUP7_9GAMM|nr:hypothetical protein [Legionella nautarum]KTD36055.1 hypothetical protein Lnau_1039 [Legionella nautarum]
MPLERFFVRGTLGLIGNQSVKLSTTLNRSFLNRSLFFAATQSTSTASKTFSLDPVEIPPEKMKSLDEMPNNGQYELMFATKSGLPIPMLPISHSAVAFKDTQTDNIFVYGRQSPWDFFNWVRDGISFRTEMDNERKYLNKNYPFTAYPTGALFAKDEIAAFFNKTDTLINKKQFCNMFNSNCYSASVTVFALALEILAKREKFVAEEINNVLKVLEGHPLQDHLSLGVMNNSVVQSSLKSAVSSVQARVTSIKNPTAAEQELQQQTEELLRTLAHEGSEKLTRDCFSI